jgi:hypothetical protein
VAKNKKNSPPRPGPVSSEGIAPRDYTWGLIILIILAAMALRVHLLDIPLERDEGEYAYAGQLILQGFLPYTHVYAAKFPGIYGAYGLVLAIFGQTIGGIHLGLLFVNLATIIFLFLLGRQLIDTTTGVVAAASFAVLSVGQGVQGVFANTEHFVILPAVAGMFIFLRDADSRRALPLFLSGLLFGLAYLMKQPGAAFIAFAFTYLVYRGWRTQPAGLRHVIAEILVLLAGAGLPLALTCLLFLASGVFNKFWFWTFTYAWEYTSMVPLTEAWQPFIDSMRPIVSSALLLWGLAGWGLLALFIDPKAGERRFFTLTLLIFSFLAVIPGFFFRPHYFILLLPAISLLIGVGISAMARQLDRVSQRAATLLPTAIILLALLHPVYQQRLYLFGVDAAMASRLTYGPNPFSESLKIAQYLQEHTSKEDSIAVIGSEPQIYFYAHRRAATGYIYTYPFMESQPYARQMQEEMIREIEASRPAYLILVNIGTSWLVRPESEMLIFDWFREYSHDFYDRVGVINILSPDHTEYLWDGVPEGYQALAPSIILYKRKPH